MTCYKYIFHVGDCTDLFVSIIDLETGKIYEGYLTPSNQLLFFRQGSSKISPPFSKEYACKNDALTNIMIEIVESNQ